MTHAVDLFPKTGQFWGNRSLRSGLSVAQDRRSVRKAEYAGQCARETAFVAECLEDTASDLLIFKHEEIQSC
jgi:hypothetical protein